MVRHRFANGGLSYDQAVRRLTAEGIDWETALDFVDIWSQERLERREHAAALDDIKRFITQRSNVTFLCCELYQGGMLDEHNAKRLLEAAGHTFKAAQQVLAGWEPERKKEGE